ncbi:MAG: phosphopantetheine-binding protein [Lachnospiraceae bacterium]|nr:phosphopantetheine-binding protein [Lachnospiraceae bacterium]
MDNSIKKSIREILLSIVEDDEKREKILSCDNIDIVEDLKFDSLDIMTFVVKISEEFDIQIQDYEDFIENLYELDSLSLWIERKL